MQAVVFCKHVLILQNNDSNFSLLRWHNTLRLVFAWIYFCEQGNFNYFAWTYCCSCPIFIFFRYFHLRERGSHCNIIVVCNKAILKQSIKSITMELIHLKSETRLINNFAKNFAWILRIWKILGRQIFTDLKNKKKTFSRKFTSLGIYSVYVQQRFLYKQYFWKKSVRIRLVNTFLTLQVFWIHFTCDLKCPELFFV